MIDEDIEFLKVRADAASFMRDKEQSLIKRWLAVMKYTNPVGYYVDRWHNVIEIYTTNPGWLIGKGGEGISIFRQMVNLESNRDWEIKLIEVRGGFIIPETAPEVTDDDAGRLTKRSKTTDMVWFIDRENDNLILEPCEMTPYHSRVAIQKLAKYEDHDANIPPNTRHVFNKEDFTEEQLQLLKMAFKLVEDVVDIQKHGNYDDPLYNQLYKLEEKLGVFDLIDDKVTVDFKLES